jgi:hypothetical protein
VSSLPPLSSISLWSENKIRKRRIRMKRSYAREEKERWRRERNTSCCKPKRKTELMKKRKKRWGTGQK